MLLYVINANILKSQPWKLIVRPFQNKLKPIRKIMTDHDKYLKETLISKTKISTYKFLGFLKCDLVVLFNAAKRLD